MKGKKLLILLMAGILVFTGFILLELGLNANSATGSLTIICGKARTCDATSVTLCYKKSSGSWTEVVKNFNSSKTVTLTINNLDAGDVYKTKCKCDSNYKIDPSNEKSVVIKEGMTERSTFTIKNK